MITSFVIPPTSDTLDAAAEVLRAGRLVAFPTETVYGLGADATDEMAVARIFEVKGRPRFNPLISHVGSAEAALALGRFSELARAAAKNFWPGPLTIVVERAVDCPIAWLTSAGLQSIALRVPAHPLANDLLRRADRPIAAPSANRSGRVSPTRAEHVNSEFGDQVSMILDGGTCSIGLESTVIDLSGPAPVLLRPGAVTREDLEALVGPVTEPSTGGPITAPGMLASHYAPSCPVRLNAASPEPGEVFLGFGAARADEPGETLSATGDLVEAAGNLFHMLRTLDCRGVSGIAVAPIPEHGLGAAINDRLTRAAAPR